MDIYGCLALALGVFVGNWLIIPLLNPLFGRRRNFTKGFFIGLIAAGLCMLLYALCYAFFPTFLGK